MRSKRNQIKAKDYDVHLAERMAHVKLSSFRMQQALDIPEVRNLPEPAVPFQMPRPTGLESGVGFGFSNVIGEKNGASVACHEVDSDCSNEVGFDDYESGPIDYEDEGQDRELLWRPPTGYVGEVEHYESSKGASEEEGQNCTSGRQTTILPRATKGRRRSNPTPYQDRKRTRVAVDLVSPNPEQQFKQPTKQCRPRPQGLTLQPDQGMPSIQITGASPQPLRASATSQVPESDLAFRSLQQATGYHQPNEQADSSDKHPKAIANTDYSLVQASLQGNAAETTRPASPPPPYLSPRLHLAHLTMPAYWSSTLSRLIYTWLLQGDTRAAQTEVADMILAHARVNPMAQYYTDVPTPPSTPLILNRLDGRWQASLKVTRLILPDGAGVTFGQSNERDWLIVQCTDRPAGTLTTMAKDTMSAKTESQTSTTTPYWILAFPATTVTNVKTDQVFTGTGIVHHTRLMVGRHGCFPLLHGRNIRTPYFADGFMRAFAQGEGMIQAMSTQPLHV
jgi:hypothetical protein